jgi:hypothetical protein
MYWVEIDNIFFTMVNCQKGMYSVFAAVLLISGSRQEVGTQYILIKLSNGCMGTQAFCGYDSLGYQNSDGLFVANVPVKGHTLALMGFF